MADGNSDFILVVDDEYSNRLLLEELLSEYSVKCADGGSEMWQILEKGTPALILMDVMMPEEDGFTLARNLAGHQKFKDIPLIFVTAKVTGEDVEKGFDLGGYDYIKKPFNQLELESRVRKALEKKKTERTLKGKVITSEKILQTMTEGILTLDTDGTILDINPGTESLLGYSAFEMKGKSVNEFCRTKNFTDYLSTDKNVSRKELELLTKVGLAVPIIASNTAIYDDSDNTYGWVSVLHDISAQKETERRLVEAKEKAEQADKLKSAFIANMSHEIRTPMNSIVGFSELLEDPEIEVEERLEYVGIIQKNSDKLLNFIDNLLDISIIEAGQIQIVEGKTHINQVLDELLASFIIIKNKQDKRHIELKLSKEVLDDNFTVITDTYRFQQILMNLLGNAIKFTKEGYIEFGYMKSIAEKTITFYVKDTGIGIPSDKLDIIFDRFGQVSNTDVQNFGGTGLGLAISRQLASLMKGELSVESEVGVGSTFYLKLPFKQ